MRPLLAALLALALTSPVMAEPLAVQPPARSRLVIAGRTGMGKSLWGQEYELRIRRLIKVDTLHELELGGGAVDVDEYVWRARRGEYRYGVLRLAVRPQRGERVEALERICRATYDHVWNVNLSIEEISLLVDGPGPSQTGEELLETIVTGRHRGISMTVYAQRFAMVPTHYRGNLSRIVAFQQPDPDDARELVKKTGGKLSVETFQELPEHHYVDWTPDHGARVCPPITLA